MLSSQNRCIMNVIVALLFMLVVVHAVVSTENESELKTQSQLAYEQYTTYYEDRFDAQPNQTRQFSLYVDRKNENYLISSERNEERDYISVIFYSKSFDPDYTYSIVKPTAESVGYCSRIPKNLKTSIDFLRLLEPLINMFNEVSEKNDQYIELKMGSNTMRLNASNPIQITDLSFKGISTVKMINLTKSIEEWKAPISSRDGCITFVAGQEEATLISLNNSGDQQSDSNYAQGVMVSWMLTQKLEMENVMTKLAYQTINTNEQARHYNNEASKVRQQIIEEKEQELREQNEAKQKLQEELNKLE